MVDRRSGVRLLLELHCVMVIKRVAIGSDVTIYLKNGYVQPRSQGLSSLPPLVVGRKTLVAAGHVPSYDTNFSTRVGSTNNFCRS